MLEVPIQNRWGEVISSFLISKEDEHLLQYTWRLRSRGEVFWRVQKKRLKS